jgi:peroxiredoxin
MSFRRPLAEIVAAIKAATPAWFGGVNDRLVKGLIDSGAADGALKADDRIPEFLLPNAEGQLVSSAQLLANGPLVLSFYRGMWCPYCSEELNALANAAPRLKAAGATVAAITPEIGGMALKTKKERNLQFEVLCDVDNGVAMEFGLMFRLPEDIQKDYLKFNVNMPKIYGNNGWMIPIPATYVVNPDGVIIYAYVNPDYRERCDPESLVDIVAGLQPVTS